MLTVVTHASWKADFLSAKQHLGFDIPSSDGMRPGVDGFWTPGHYASLMHLKGDPWRFQDCYWWEYEDRVTHHYSAESAAESINGDMFVKLARHKLDYFPARVMNREQFLELARHDNEYIVSPILDLVEEHRVWVINGSIAASSCYHLGDWWWDGEGNNKQLRNTGDGLAFYLPGEAYCIDIGYTVDGELVLVEGNPPWCVGFYSAPAEVIRESCILSQGLSIDNAFVPDLDTAKKMKMIIDRM